MPCFKILLILLVVAGGMVSNVVLADTTASLRPTTDGGDDSGDWKNTAGVNCTSANCYLELDESSGSSCTNSDGDTSYIEAKPSGASITFDINESSIPDDSTITAIDITVCYKQKKAAESNNFQTKRCVDASCSNSSTNISAGAVYAEATQSHSGLNITKTGSTDIEIGAIIIGTEVRISQISAVITYTPLAPAPGCGDGNLDPGEECDDGNNNNGDGCSSICQIETGEPSTPSEPGPGGGRTIKVVLSGQAYPESKIEVLRRGSSDEDATYLTVPLETHQVSDDGMFDLSLGALVSDEYFFALRAEDKDGRKTGIIAFDVDLKTTNTLEAKGIFMPPTVELEKTVASRDQTINIFGYAGPRNLIEIEIDGFIVQTIEAGEDGYWTAVISTSALTPRDHAVRVRQIDLSGQKSRFSLTKNLKISLLEFPEVDFSGDDIINITDWSVFLFRWSQDDENVRSTIDLNKDGKINISDFSMFLNMMKIQ